MIAQRFVKPVLVAGFFIFSGAAPAQNSLIQPSGSPSSIVPYVQADTSGVSVSPEPLPVAESNARSLALRVQQLEEEIRRLNGLIEEQASLLTRLQDQSLERYVEVDRRLAMIATVGVVDAPDDPSVSKGPVAATDGGETQEMPVAPQMGEQEAYQAAYGLVRERRFSDALTAFDTFLSQYPFGRFAPNAHYWLGELYLVVEPVDPEAARQNFQVLLDQYPTDRKVPDALYKLGRVHVHVHIHSHSLAPYAHVHVNFHIFTFTSSHSHVHVHTFTFAHSRSRSWSAHAHTFTFTHPRSHIHVHIFPFLFVPRWSQIKLGIAEGRGGQRGPENVWGSAATGTICALALVKWPQLAGLMPCHVVPCHVMSCS